MANPEPTTQASHPVGGTRGRAAVIDPYAEIPRLARSTVSRGRYFSQSLQCVVRAFGSPYGAIYVRYGAEVIQDDAHSGPTDPRFWKDSLQQFLTESLTEARPQARLLQAKGGSARVAFLSAPLFDPAGPSIGAMAVVVPLTDEADWTTRLAALEGVCRVTSLGTELLGGASQGSPNARGGGRTPDRLLIRAAACESAEELAFAITNELRNKLGCEQVILGLAAGHRLRILSTSGLDQVNRRSPGLAVLRSAMEECLDAGAAIVHPRQEDPPDPRFSREYPSHKLWHAAAKGDAVASIPLRLGETVAAVLGLRGRSERIFSAEQLEDIRSQTEPLMPAVSLVRRATRGAARHSWESLLQAAKELLTPGRWGRKIVAGLGLAAVFVFFFGCMPYELAVPCVVTPAQVRHLHAPFPGALRAAHAVQGDRVSAGQVLCEFDHEELDQARLELLAQWEVLERERDRALAANAPVEVQLALANQQLVGAKLDIVTGRIARAGVRAPIDGVVVWGDLRKSIGAVLEQGHPLFRVAAEDRWTLELEVPDSSAKGLTAGLTGVFAAAADPTRQTTFAITRVQPGATQRRASNVFVAEADVELAAEWLKPGMEGVAKIHLGRRWVSWMATHRVLDYLRLHFWL